MKIKQDSLLKECSRPKCQFPTRCFWTRIREQEATESFYIINQCLTTDGKCSQSHRHVSTGTSQNYTLPDDLLLPATGAGSADLDHQVNHTSTIVPQVKSEKAQQMHLSSDRIEPIESKEETEDVKKVAIILKETMSQDNNSIEKEKWQVRHFPITPILSREF